MLNDLYSYMLDDLYLRDKGEWFLLHEKICTMLDDV